MTKLSDYALTAEAADILGVSQNTVRTWAKDGKIPVHRNPANGYRLFKRRDLEQFLKRIERSAITTSPKRKRVNRSGKPK
ncbi:polar chromosome segregation protein [Rubripirellula obstinata]|uniref:Polar chromosome segregation protein n=1 Tax=Rubripirellula obstinata TaxID=406547 RepID=A0A5B1CCY4_9BACT|nr:helix-turn-helix domain-containing protein [Rubripirellula obstinata]KAA1258072.1 polar chromosome segregation protein [Rubripirellula obstinata]